MEQLERGCSAWKRNKSKSYRWWLKRWTSRRMRRNLRQLLDEAPRRVTKGYEW